MSLSHETLEAVQAALLESQCSPQEAVLVALRAVASFAVNEDVCPEDDAGKKAWEQLCAEAWATAPKIT